MDKTDTAHSAKLIIDMFGEDAADQAAQFSDAMLDRGDRKNAKLWSRILQAILKIQGTDDRAGS